MIHLRLAPLSAALTRPLASSTYLQTEHERLRKRLADANTAIPETQKDWRGFASGAVVTALDCWLAADAVLASTAPATLEIALDSPGHAATRLDESVGLSDYVAHLGLCLCERSGGRVSLKITGEAAGAIYVALAAPAARVLASAAATVRVLPRNAVARVLGTAPPDSGLDEALAAGVIDEVIPA